MKKSKCLIVVTALLCLCLVLSACGKNPDKKGDKNPDNGTYCTVTFDSRGGSNVESRRVLKGNPISVPESPTKFGYTFNGWYKSTDENAELWKFATDRVTTDTTLYAFWDPEKEISEPTTTLTFELNAGRTGYIVTGDGGQSTNIVIPAEYNELPVVEIGESAFAYSKRNSDIVSVTIPDTVTAIGKNAFYSRQDDLTTVNIGENSLLTTIGNNAFSGCRALTAIYLPAGVTVIGDSAFNNCGALNSITVAAGNTAYSGEGNNLIEIATHTLIRGSNLSVIPESVTTIAPAAFRRAALTTLIIPVSVISIGNYIIQDSAVASITYKGTAAQWEAVDKARYWNMGKTDIEIVCSETKDPEEPEPTATLTYALNEAKTGYIVTGDSGQSEDIVIPAVYNELPVVEIGESALSWGSHKSDIVSVTIPDSVKTIGLNAFNNREDDLTTVNIGENSQLTTIGNNAFSGCRALTAIYIPAGVTFIGDSAFNNCGGLNTITVAEGNTVYSGEGNNLIEKASHTLIRGSNLSVIPESVTTIAPAAFRRATRTTLTIPVSVTSIGNYIIQYSAITSIVYEGTMAEWQVVQKASLWNIGKTNIEVICSDSE